MNKAIVLTATVQEPYGAVVDLPDVSSDETISIDQELTHPFDYELMAELMVDDQPVASSFPTRCGPDNIVHFRFPPMAMRRQRVGIRYVGRLNDEWYLLDFHEARPC